MLIDILLKGQKALVVGGGRVGERKVLQLLDAGFKVTVCSRDVTERLKEMGRTGRIDIKKVDLKQGSNFISDQAPKIVIVALNERWLNRKIAKEARSMGALVCVVDDPLTSDFAMPAVAKIGDIRVGVSTEGSSPAMAGVLRRRIEQMITKRDLLMVELQRHVRTFAKDLIDSQEERRVVLYEIIEDDEVRRFLEKGQIDEARHRAETIITNASGTVR
jgi:precorrin-2 dehydrogenase/sirohydrochlorin ferrochelatase